VCLGGGGGCDLGQGIRVQGQEGGVGAGEDSGLGRSVGGGTGSGRELSPGAGAMSTLAASCTSNMQIRLSVEYRPASFAYLTSHHFFQKRLLRKERLRCPFLRKRFFLAQCRSS